MKVPAEGKKKVNLNFKPPVTPSPVTEFQQFVKAPPSEVEGLFAIAKALDGLTKAIDRLGIAGPTEIRDGLGEIAEAIQGKETT